MLIHENPLMDRENSGQVMSVDLGVKTGIAVFSSEGRLRWFGSRNYGSINSLRNDLPRLLHSHAPLRVLVLEGGGVLENVWMREAHYRNIAVVSFHAGHWRQLFFGSDPLMHTNRAKMKAVDLARCDRFDWRKPGFVAHSSCSRSHSYRPLLPLRGRESGITR
ncbi:MAG: hypothetical protein GX459_04980 [Bacteroidales bacterium]|nr:hypothetical protein [Bacteroidales bacterium]